MFKKLEVWRAVNYKETELSKSVSFAVQRDGVLNI